MNKRLVGVLAFALAVSAGASFLLYQLINARLANSVTAGNHEVITAARDLAVGTLIKDVDVKVITQNSPAPPSAVKKVEDVIGRGVVSNVYAGEPILENRLAAKGAGAGMAATIPIGMRAVAMRVDDIIGVSGFVTVGARVDLLIMGTPPNWSASLGTLSKTLLQNIEVLSAGQQVQKDNEGKPIAVPVVNLLVTPQQAEVVSLATSQARIQLILRNPLDKEDSKTTGAVYASLFTGSNQPPPVNPGSPKGPSQPRPRPIPVAPAPPPVQAKAVEKPPAPIIVEILHGARRGEAKFANESKDEKESKAAKEAK
jgi:pilus assembly protein CpaB